MIEELNASKLFSFDTETSSLNPVHCRLVGLSLSASPGKAFYIPIGHKTGKQLKIEYILSKLKPLFENPLLAPFSAIDDNYTFRLASEDKKLLLRISESYLNKENILEIKYLTG